MAAAGGLGAFDLPLPVSRENMAADALALSVTEPQLLLLDQWATLAGPAAQADGAAAAPANCNAGAASPLPVAAPAAAGSEAWSLAPVRQR